MSYDPVSFISDMEKTVTVPCRIKMGWDGEGKTGQYFGFVAFGGTKWAIVLWDDDVDPDLHKAAGLEILQMSWTPLGIT